MGIAVVAVQSGVQTVFLGLLPGISAFLHFAFISGSTWWQESHQSIWATFFPSTNPKENYQFSIALFPISSFFKWPDSYQPLQDHMLISSTLSRRRMFLLSSYTTYSKIQSDCTKLGYSFSPEQITVLGREREWHEEVNWSGLEEGPSKKSCS